MNKNQTKFKLLILNLILVTSFFAGCKKEDDETVKEDPRTVFDVISSSVQFSFLEAAIIKAELAETLKAPGNITFFAPSNDAFKAAGFADEAAVTAASKETLAAIINYHLINSQFLYSSITKNLLDSAIQSAGGGELLIGRRFLPTTTAATTFNQRSIVNGVLVHQSDAAVKNGQVNIITKLLMPPIGNLLQTVQANADLSLFAAAITRASEGTTNLSTLLSGTEAHTVFAPNNFAFIAANYPDVASIQAADPEVLANLLKYHIIPNDRVLSTSVNYSIVTSTSGSLTPVTLQGGNFTFTMTGTIGAVTAGTIKGFGNPSNGNITQWDNVSNNGVLHVIDKVLLPPPAI